MRREKSPGLKILWIWTIGTAAILVTSVLRTRMRDLENAMNAENHHQQQIQQQQHQQQNRDALIDSALVDTVPPSEELISDDKV